MLVPTTSIKRLLQQTLSVVIALAPAALVFTVAGRLLPWMLRQKAPYAAALVYACAPKYHAHLRRLHGAGHLVCCDVPLGYRMYLPVTDNHFAHRRFGVYHPPSLLQTIERLCRPGARVCELGTHLGEMTLYMARLVGAEGAVYAFEIDDAFHRILAQSLAANGFHHVRLEHKAIGVPGTIAVGSGYGDAATAMENFPELNVASSLGVDYFTGTPETWNRSEIPRPAGAVVERIDLAEYFAAEPSIDVFFMDIEGCEVFAIPAVLRLARRWGCRPRIVFEVHHNAYSGPQARELRESLLAAGYRMSSPDQRHVVCE
jgi:FkbM family methyltransferase